MGKLLRLVAFSLLFGVPNAWAQRTLVSGTVRDPSGIPYARGTIVANLVPTGNATIPGGSSACPAPGPCAIQGQAGPTPLDDNGAFILSLFDNTVIQPAATQWAFTVSIAPGIPLPGGTDSRSFSVTLAISGVSQDIGANLSAAAPALSRGGQQSQVLDARAFGVQATTKFCFGNAATGAVTSGTATVDCSTANFTAADLFKKIRATNGCCNTSVPIAGVSIIPANAVIVAIVSPTRVTISLNATATCTTTCLIAWGPDDTAALTALSAAMAASNNCAAAVLPAGAMLTTRGQFNLASASCAAPFSDVQAGHSVTGQGISQSIIVPSPGEFDYTQGAGNSCGGGTGNRRCFMAGVTQFRDWSIFGMFNSEAGSPAHNNLILAGPCNAVLTGNCFGDRWGIFDWDAGDAAGIGSDTVGLLLSGYYSHVFSLGAGNIACRAENGAISTTLTDSICGNSLRTNLLVATGSLISGLKSKGNLFGQTASAQATVSVGSGSFWVSEHDTIFNNPGGQANTLVNVLGSTAIIKDMIALNPGTGAYAGIFCDATATCLVQNSRFQGGTTNFAAVCGAGCIFESQFGNTFTSGGGGTTSGVITGPIMGPVLFADLGTPANGRIVFCSNCTIANPCAGAGTGALAKRLNGVWVCN